MKWHVVHFNSRFYILKRNCESPGLILGLSKKARAKVLRHNPAFHSPRGVLRSTLVLCCLLSVSCQSGQPGAGSSHAKSSRWKPLGEVGDLVLAMWRPKSLLGSAKKGAASMPAPALCWNYCLEVPLSSWSLNIGPLLHSDSFLFVC